MTLPVCLFVSAMNNPDAELSSRIGAMGENMVMKRIVQRVEGHRVVVMEVGPPDSERMQSSSMASHESGSDDIIRVPTDAG